MKKRLVYTLMVYKTLGVTISLHNLGHNGGHSSLDLGTIFTSGFCDALDEQDPKPSTKINEVFMSGKFNENFK